MSCFSKIPFFQNSDLRVKSLFILKRHLFTDLLTFFKKTTESFQKKSFFGKRTESFQKNVILENQKRTFSKYVTFSGKEQNNFKRTLFGKRTEQFQKTLPIRKEQQNLFKRTLLCKTIESFQKNIIRRMDLLPPTFYVGRRLWKQ